MSPSSSHKEHLGPDVNKEQIELERIPRDTRSFFWTNREEIGQEIAQPEQIT
jgi:hypothetical protein